MVLFCEFGINVESFNHVEVVSLNTVIFYTDDFVLINGIIMVITVYVLHLILLCYSIRF
jgi:hypothetical protein